MPYTSSDAHGFTHKANTPRRSRQWAAVYESSRSRGDDEGTAITKANGVVKKTVKSDKKRFGHKKRATMEKQAAKHHEALARDTLRRMKTKAKQPHPDVGAAAAKGRGKGMAWGAGLGGGAGAIVGAVASKPGQRMMGVAKGLAIGGVAGGGLGALIGHMHGRGKAEDEIDEIEDAKGVLQNKPKDRLTIVARRHEEAEEAEKRWQRIHEEEMAHSRRMAMVYGVGEAAKGIVGAAKKRDDDDDDEEEEEGYDYDDYYASKHGSEESMDENMFKEAALDEGIPFRGLLKEAAAVPFGKKLLGGLGMKGVGTRMGIGAAVGAAGGMATTPTGEGGGSMLSRGIAGGAFGAAGGALTHTKFRNKMIPSLGKVGKKARKP